MCKEQPRSCSTDLKISTYMFIKFQNFYYLLQVLRSRLTKLSSIFFNCIKKLMKKVYDTVFI